MLADRVMKALNADKEISTAMGYGVADPAMIKEWIVHPIDADDETVIVTMRGTEGRAKAYRDIMRYRGKE